jgi:hypothetical protein
MMNGIDINLSVIEFVLISLKSFNWFTIIIILKLKHKKYGLRLDSQPYFFE